jgi:hypothetical protein
MTIVEATPYASHFQFRVEDSAESGCCDIADAWSDLPENRRLAATPHTIAVGTARYATVPVSLTVYNAAPITEVNTYQHVEEADLLLPSGELHINDGVVSDNPTRIVLAPGRYRLRVAYEPLTVVPPDADEVPGDHMTYRMWLWPVGMETEPVVLLQGATTWAG